MSSHDPHDSNQSENRLQSFQFDENNVGIGSPDPDTLVGDDRQDFLFGLEGDDKLAGNEGNDALYGGPGGDLLTGGAMRDLLIAGNGDDTLYGGADEDTLMGEAGNDYLDEGPGHSEIDGGEGDDTLIGGPGPDAFVLRPGSGDDVIKDFTPGPGMFDHLALEGGLRWEDLSIEDTDQGAHISWEDGSVLLEGVVKADLAQDDFMFADEPDLPPGPRGPDGPASLRPSMSSSGPDINAVTLGFSAMTFDNRRDLAFDDNQMRIGTEQTDILHGDQADTTQLFGRTGSDVLLGGAHQNVIQGGPHADLLVGGAGPNWLDAGDGGDVLIGNARDDNLIGNAGRDVVAAGAAHDMLDGGEGDDTLIGGPGADAFMVNPTSGNDIVLDFKATGEAQGAFDHIAFMDIAATQLQISDVMEGVLISWDTDADGQANGSIRLDGVMKSDLRQSDFMFTDRPQFVDGISSVGSEYIFPAT